MIVIRILQNAWRLFANEPPTYLFGDRKILGEDRIQVKEDLLHFLGSKDTRPIFLIGAWGSGKTTFIRSLEPEIRKRSRYLYRSFFAVSNSNAAYLSLLPRYIWIAFSLIALAVLARVGYIGTVSPRLKEFKDLIIITISVAGFLFVSNRMKIFYILASFLNTRLWGKNYVTVVDDIERSSLSSSDGWAILSNLWTEGHKYLILLGYESDKDKSEIIERAIKLDGHLIFLPTDYNVNFKIAKDLDPKFAFTGGEWLGHLTPRDVVRIFIAVNKESTSYDSDGYRRVLYVNHYFRKLMDRLGIASSDYIHINIGIRQQGTHKSLVMDLRAYSQERNPLIFIGRDISQFHSSLVPEVQASIANQDAAAIAEIFKTDNIFQLRRLFGSFTQEHKVGAGI